MILLLSSPFLPCWAAGLVLSLARAAAGSFLVHDPLGNFEPLQGALGRRGTVRIHSCTRNAWEPHITLSCLKDLIPQAFQGNFG